jgi:hypothetical protein
MADATSNFIFMFLLAQSPPLEELRPECVPVEVAGKVVIEGGSANWRKEQGHY